MKNTDTSTESTGKPLREPITEVAAWRANELEDTSRWLVQLNEEEIAEIVKATRNAAEMAVVKACSLGASVEIGTEDSV